MHSTTGHPENEISRLLLQVESKYIGILSRVVFSRDNFSHVCINSTHSYKRHGNRALSLVDLRKARQSRQHLSAEARERSEELKRKRKPSRSDQFWSGIGKVEVCVLRLER
jgi:hypothetical protein